MEGYRFDLIMTVVNTGYSNDVMEAAKRAGAFGGTIVRGRGTGVHELKKFFGTVLEPEKETVMILTERENRNRIMEAIANDAGLSKDGMGICFSMPVDAVKGIKRFENGDEDQRDPSSQKHLNDHTAGLMKQAGIIEKTGAESSAPGADDALKPAAEEKKG